MKIKFNKPTWVLSKITGGFTGETTVKACELDTDEIMVSEIIKDYHSSDIRISVAGDFTLTLINVPNSKFKVIKPLYEEDELFCTNCKECTTHLCKYSEHERDSSGDFFICQKCKWEYSSYTGKYHEPS